MTYENIPGVPDFLCHEYHQRTSEYCILIPVINEGGRIANQLRRAKDSGIDRLCDIIICDGGSDDGSVEPGLLQSLGVNTLLTKTGPGRQGAQLRMGIWFALERGYGGVITVDGNDKDSIEDAGLFTDKLGNGYDLVQGSRFMAGGRAKNTPPIRYLAARLIHAPVISLVAGQRFTDTTNAYRAYSRRYLTHPQVQPLRDVFAGYELLAYMSTKASQLGLGACEVPVTRVYPERGKTPTKISFWQGNTDLLKILFRNARGKYDPANQ